MSSYVFLEPHSPKKPEGYLRVGFRLLCWSLGLLYLYGVLYLVVAPDEGSPEDSRAAWCEEYHPELTFSQCAERAGW